jgi:multicomponent Na+:H+ antiporter subunit D
MFNHALAKGALFVAVACLAMRVGALTLDDGLVGAGRRQPLTMAAFIIAGLSLIGMPGTAGFVSKWYRVSAALGLGSWGVLLLLPVLIRGWSGCQPRMRFSRNYARSKRLSAANEV